MGLYWTACLLTYTTLRLALPASEVEALPSRMEPRPYCKNVIDTAKVAEEKGDAAPTESSIKKKVEREKVGYDLENMSRVLPAQIKYISFAQEGRYQPVKKVSFLYLHIPSVLHTGN